MSDLPGGLPCVTIGSGPPLVSQRLNEITAPVLVIVGGRDRAFPVDLVRETAAGIPGARLVIYPRCGHLGTMLHPRFGRDVSRFLNEPSPQPV